MSAMGRPSKIEGVLNKSLNAGPLKPINHRPGGKTYYCPNCYSFDLWYREVENGIFDVTCKQCDKHWTKYKKSEKSQEKSEKSEKSQEKSEKTLDKEVIL